MHVISGPVCRTQLSVRTRFEVFKRDDFQCRYCGRRSPDVVLQVDHITPVALGGTDDEVNLVTSCWECNAGKAAVPLDAVITGEDPHDRAIELLERERQVREYNVVLERVRLAREQDAEMLMAYWLERTKRYFTNAEEGWLSGALKYCPREIIRDFMDRAVSKRAISNLSYVGGCVRSWRGEERGNG